MPEFTDFEALRRAANLVRLVAYRRGLRSLHVIADMLAGMLVATEPEKEERKWN